MSRLHPVAVPPLSTKFLILSSEDSVYFDESKMRCHRYISKVIIAKIVVLVNEIEIWDGFQTCDL